MPDLPPVYDTPEALSALFEEDPAATLPLQAVAVRRGPLCLGPDNCIEGTGADLFAPEPLPVLQHAGGWPRVALPPRDGVALTAWLDPDGLAPMVQQTTTADGVTLAAGLPLGEGGRYEDAIARFEVSIEGLALGAWALPEPLPAPDGRPAWMTGGPLRSAPEVDAAPLAWLRPGAPLRVFVQPDGAAPEDWALACFSQALYRLCGYVPRSRLPQHTEPDHHLSISHGGGYGRPGPMVAPLVWGVPAGTPLHAERGGPLIGLAVEDTTLRRAGPEERRWVPLEVPSAWGALTVWARGDDIGDASDEFVAALGRRAILHTPGEDGCARWVLDLGEQTLLHRRGSVRTGSNIVYAGAGQFNLSSPQSHVTLPDGSEAHTATGEAWVSTLAVFDEGHFELDGRRWFTDAARCEQEVVR